MVSECWLNFKHNIAVQQSLTSSSKPKNEDHESGSKETVDEEEVCITMYHSKNISTMQLISVTKQLPKFSRQKVYIYVE
jgi:hypothetical protein